MYENDRPNSLPKESRPDTDSMPTLREFWDELQRARAAQEAFGLPSAGSGTAGSGSGSSGSSGSAGSGGGGYGLGLIAADEDSQRRIRAIMQELCEKDAAKK